jgi:hypothetical protein
MKEMNIITNDSRPDPIVFQGRYALIFLADTL